MVSVTDAQSGPVRDQILTHAHSLYTTTPKDKNLLPMLHCLHELHPKHLPILLLLACVYFSRDNVTKSLYYNSKILEIDPNYVEAMSNIGTTLRSTGRCSEAESWWWRAIRLRPGYWDAVENLLGVLCSQNCKDTRTATSKQTRYTEAMEVCTFVESHVFSNAKRGVPLSPKHLGIAAVHTPRIQNLLYTKGNLLYAMGDSPGAKKEYERALEIVFDGHTLAEVVSSIARLAGMSTEEQSNPGSLPMLLLIPEQAVQICKSIFVKSDGMLPGLASGYEKKAAGYSPSSSSVQQTNQTCSNILLTLAKLYQDNGSPAPLQLLLPIYYLSLSLYPSPSTCNNLGILLSTVGAPAPTPKCSMPLNGPALAYQYYTYGLTLDSRHPHLYTNLGSLLKDMGRLQDAIRMYEKAVECNPRFDIALANLGNAVKDIGRVQDSIQWYMRAVEVNPDFGEAICGLVNALGGVCDWRGRGGPADCVVKLEKGAEGVLVRSEKKRPSDSTGWMMDKVSRIVDKQLTEGLEWGRGILLKDNSPHGTIIAMVSKALGIEPLDDSQKSKINDWIFSMSTFESRVSRERRQDEAVHRNEGSWLIRIVERCMRYIQRRWYLDQYKYGRRINDNEATLEYQRPILPSMSPPSAPTVLPFHTFTYPLSPRQIRLISHRNAVRISHNVLNSSWLPATVYPPPPPPSPLIKIGYVSSDFNNHPLSHLMQSVFGLHDPNKFMVYCYATTANDQSPYRAKIEREAHVFQNVSSWTTQAIVEQIVQDGIHILVNLNGYTKGARNEVFAARPAPILMAYMGFAGSLGAGWCDYLIADPVVCPPELVACERWRNLNNMEGLSNYQIQDGHITNNHEVEGIAVGDMDPEEASEEWVYTEKMIYMPHSYFVNDHRQGFRDEEDMKSTGLSTQANPELIWKLEQKKRWTMRRELFPNLSDDTVIFANFNQLYKIDPSIFKVWLRILSRVPNSIMWLLRFPAAGEAHLLRTAEEYAGKDVASRVIFTDVAPKNVHIHRGRVADLFLDTPECNGHTTGCDILWSGTPILTYPRHNHKLCSRVAASIAIATGHGDKMVVASEMEYEDVAVKYAQDLTYEYVADDQPAYYRVGHGILMDLRQDLFLKRDRSPLFDTPRWVRNLEKGYLEAWRRWDSGEEFTPKGWRCIWVDDEESVHR
ncbi:protein prenylyltransferase [Basidiobolus meristosporus CBS 931.73]|uniref:protein O-GlcNAc transferase n=1 Tax=Basidiobolus meristosporus CBS 931.73 TaxID=1314790 RepID=A0A1Y1ZDH7_9FUNG|nr:protein prenylyltransferase [Basidiobolus meristosporus CBS 931.73]|eukprot:ORY08017.1 protein prenylyltransferase [Basidiobolus meristosporus CBS 931.73]